MGCLQSKPRTEPDIPEYKPSEYVLQMLAKQQAYWEKNAANNSSKGPSYCYPSREASLLLLHARV